MTRAHRISLLLVMAVVLATAAAVVATPVVVINEAFHDIFIPLDGAWRIVNGQWPHRDFHTPVGGLWYALHAVTYALLYADVRAIPATSAAVAVLLAGAASWVAIRRFDPLASATFTLFVFGIAGGAGFLDNVEGTEWLGTYNRWCWSLCAIALVITSVETRDGNGVRPAADGLLLGVALGALLWLKITFAACAVSCVIATAVLARSTQRRRIAMVGLLTLVPAALALTSPLGRGYLVDLRDAAALGSGLSRLHRLPGILLANLVPLAIVGVLVIVLALRRAVARTDLLLVMAWVGFALVISTQNNERTSVLVSVAPLVFAASWRPTDRLQRVVRVVALLLLLRFCLLDFYGIGWAVAQGHGYFLPPTSPVVTPDGRLVVDDHFHPPPNEAFHRAVLGFPPRDDEQRETSNQEEAVEFARGLKLARSIAGSRDRIAVLAFADPFPSVLRLPPPRGIIQWFDAGRTWSPESTPVHRLFGDATLLLEPAFARDWRTSRTAIAATHTALATGWTKVASTPLWTVWRRRGADPTIPG